MIWRIGLMGASSTPAMLIPFLGALEHVLRTMGHKGGSGAVAAAMEPLAQGLTSSSVRVRASSAPRRLLAPPEIGGAQPLTRRSSSADFAQL